MIYYDIKNLHFYKHRFHIYNNYYFKTIGSNYNIFRVGNINTTQMRLYDSQ